MLNSSKAVGSKGKGKGKGKWQPKAPAKPEVQAKQTAAVKTNATPKYRPKPVLPQLYTNAICPFAHRAAFAVALQEQEVKVTFIPLSGQLNVAEKVSVDAVNPIGPFKGMTAEQLRTMKDDYVQSINASGEVPTLKTAQGELIFESEIVAEYIGATKGKANLMPGHPVKAAKVRLAMKRFNDVVAPLYQLLMNQDPSADSEKGETIKTKLSKFAESIDSTGPFCFGDKVTLADVHCAPFLYRFKLLLKHFRGFDLFADQPSGERLPKLLGAIEALPAFQKLTPVNSDELLSAYNSYAHAMKWAEKPTKEAMYVGRGKSEFSK